MTSPVNLIVTSNAFSHRKVGGHIAEALDLPFLIVAHDFEPEYEMYPNLIYVGTIDFSSVARFSRYDLISGNSIYYGTVEGLPVTTPKMVQALKLKNTRVVAVSNYVKQMLKKVGIRVDDVLHHAVKPVAPDRVYERWIKGLKKGDRKMVTWISANQRRKGLDLLPTIARSFDEKTLFLIVTGLGEVDLAPLKSLKNVHLYTEIGSLTEEQLSSIYELSDVVISTSLSEGFGLTIAEALSYGKKVLTPRYQPFTEYVKEDFTVPIDKAWWELYKGYMWFEMKSVDVEEYVERLRWVLSLETPECGSWTSIDVYKKFAEYLTKS